MENDKLMVLEAEIGSRAFSDLLAENGPVAVGVIRKRIGFALPRPKIKPVVPRSSPGKTMWSTVHKAFFRIERRSKKGNLVAVKCYGDGAGRREVLKPSEVEVWGESATANRSWGD